MWRGAVYRLRSSALSARSSKNRFRAKPLGFDPLRVPVSAQSGDYAELER